MFSKYVNFSKDIYTIYLSRADELVTDGGMDGHIFQSGIIGEFFSLGMESMSCVGMTCKALEKKGRV